MSKPTESFSALPTTRRTAISALAVAAATVIGSGSTASAWSLFRRNSAPSSEPVDLSGISQEWLRREGSEVAAYADFLSKIGLRHLQPSQVIAAHAKRRGSVWNKLPPRAMWKNIAPTLKVVDRISEELGQPVKEVISVYRCAAYNARCAGASSGSWHQKNFAVDVSFAAPASVVASKARRLRGEGFFKGGVGRYPTFTHIDTRGQNVDW